MSDMIFMAVTAVTWGYLGYIRSYLDETRLHFGLPQGVLDVFLT